jgi:hypothetical protein
MAVAVEGTPSYAVSEAGTYTAETTGTNRLLVICITGEDSGTPDINTDVTFGGVVCTPVVEKRAGGATGPYQTTAIYYLKQADIPAGAQAIAVDYDSGALTDGPFFDCFTLSGVDQTTPVDDFASSSLDNVPGTTLGGQLALDTNTVDGLAFALIAITTSASTFSNWGTGWSELQDTALGGSYRRGLATAVTSGATTTPDPTFSSSQSFAAGVSAAFKPATASASIAPLVAHYRMLRGS